MDTLTITTTPSTHAPTYHGICYAQCFSCGYGTANTTTLEAWNDLSGDCPRCMVPGRILWVLTGGRVSITTADGTGLVASHDLRLGDADGTPPDAPGTLTGPEPEPDVCADGCGLDVDHDAPCRPRPGGIPLTAPANGQRVTFPDVFGAEEFVTLDREAGIYRTDHGTTQINSDAARWEPVEH